jgi:hypothetical protein
VTDPSAPPSIGITFFERGGGERGEEEEEELTLVGIALGSK